METARLQMPAPAGPSHPTPEHTAIPADAIPAHRLFWAWYGAGVDTVRYAFDVQSMLFRQMVEVSPVSLAFQVPVAFHAALQAFHMEHDRALA